MYVVVVFSPCVLSDGFHVLCLVDVLLQLTFWLAMAQVSCVFLASEFRQHDAGLSFHIQVVSRSAVCLCI